MKYIKIIFYIILLTFVVSCMTKDMGRDVKIQSGNYINKTDEPVAEELHKNSLEIARLNAETHRLWQEYSNKPRRKFLTANTKDYKYAAYMDAWKSKIERIANSTYFMEKMHKENIHGSLTLVLDTAINPDGSINEITIRRSSENKIFDDMAVGVVEHASPFQQFSEEIRNEVDILHIIRTWQFVR